MVALSTPGEFSDVACVDQGAIRLDDYPELLPAWPRQVSWTLCFSIAAAGVSIFSGQTQAAIDRYDYDSLGRLARRLDDQTKSTDYRYDASGNVVQVTAPEVAEPPVISVGSIGDFRRNEIRQVTLSGNNLSGVTVRASYEGMIVSSLMISKTAISFRLAVNRATPLGAQSLILQNSVGSAKVGLNVVAPVLVSLEPQPISLAPDSIARKFNLILSEPSTAGKTYTLSTLAPNIAKPVSSNVPFVVGQVQTNVGLIGVAQGTTTLRISSQDLIAPLEQIVFVSAGAATPFRNSPAVGIARAVPWSVSPFTSSVSGGVGVSRGVPWATSPSNQAESGPVGVSRATPWSTSPMNLATSGSVGIFWNTPWSTSPTNLASSASIGISRGSIPWATSANAGPVVAPLVGITKP